MKDWKLFFVVMAAEDAKQRAVYEVCIHDRQPTLSQKMLINGEGTSLLFSAKPIEYADVAHDRVHFHASIEAIECPLVGVFLSMDHAVDCLKAKDLQLLDVRWLPETRKNVALLRERFPHICRCGGACGQGGCL